MEFSTDDVASSRIGKSLVVCNQKWHHSKDCLDQRQDEIIWKVVEELVLWFYSQELDTAKSSIKWVETIGVADKVTELRWLAVTLVFLRDMICLQCMLIFCRQGMPGIVECDRLSSLNYRCSAGAERLLLPDPIVGEYTVRRVSFMNAWALKGVIVSSLTLFVIDRRLSERGMQQGLFLLSMLL